jgi:hypothetical protein
MLASETRNNDLTVSFGSRFGDTTATHMTSVRSLESVCAKPVLIRAKPYTIEPVIRKSVRMMRPSYRSATSDHSYAFNRLPMCTQGSGSSVTSASACSARWATYRVFHRIKGDILEVDEKEAQSDYTNDSCRYTMVMSSVPPSPD